MKQMELTVGSGQKYIDTSPAEATVLMPIGGLATRARSITKDAIPKHLLRLGGQTVLDRVCQGLQRAGFKNFVFCVGWHKDQIREHIEQEGWIVGEDIEYAFSEENQPLGADGAVLQAIDRLGLDGQGIVVPGDVMLPWGGLASMMGRHKIWGSDLTIGVTSHVTERTTDVGKMIIEEGTDRILRCYGRDENPKGYYGDSRALTSAATTAIHIPSYVAMCQQYREANPTYEGALSVRDHILPLASQLGEFTVHAYDIHGEVLDLGTPANIQYGQAHWQDYV